MFPNMRHALEGWVRKKSIVTYRKTIVDYETVLIPTDYIAWINYQPMPPQRIDKKPEEERAWVWWDIYMDNSLELKIKDWIVIDDKNFQIMARHNWSLSGFYHYECVESFMPSTA